VIGRHIEAARETCAAFDRQFGRGAALREALAVWTSGVFFVVVLLGIALIVGGN